METTPPAAAAGPFELSGGALCLDFANTWADRQRPETDQLGAYDQLLVFATQTGHLGDLDRERLTRRAARELARAETAFASARELREALYRLFAGRARGRPIAAGDVEIVNRALREALPHLQVEPGGAAEAWGWRQDFDSLAAPLWPIARSAAELLTSPDLARVRECDGSHCTWLFLDCSRGRSRRWCSMQSCGNRAKARRHYQRRKAE